MCSLNGQFIRILEQLRFLACNTAILNYLAFSLIMGYMCIERTRATNNLVIAKQDSGAKLDYVKL